MSLKQTLKVRKQGFLQEVIILRDIGYQIRNNMINDKNGDLLADSPNILILRRSS
jgi:hypothetical protein